MQFDSVTRIINKLRGYNDDTKLMLGKLLIEQNKAKQNIKSLHDVEFKVFSQWGDDGIIQHLINNIEISNKSFIEFGVETYHESNTRFLLMNNNWSGLVIDGSEKNISNIKKQDVFWKYGLEAECSFITKDNINNIFAKHNYNGNIGILSVDIDGNDYWITEAINTITADVLIMEFNSVFGNDRAISVPYNETFTRSKGHFSNLYYGISLKAANHIATKKGYAFVGCNSNGNNAYFVLKTKLNAIIKEVNVDDNFVESKFKESRGQDGKMTFLTGNKRLESLKGLPVINVLNNTEETL